MKRIQLAAMLVGLLTQTVPVTAWAADPVGLTVAAQSRSMIWNAVAVDHGRVLVAGPRWTGAAGPSVAVIGKDGKPQPYPDAAWNGWEIGAPTAKAFVNVNSIHLDGKGALWVVDTGTPNFGSDPLPGAAKLVQIDLASNRVKRVVPLGSDVVLPGSYVDDIRFNGTFAYLTDAGRPGLIVFDMKRNRLRRVLDKDPSTTAPANRPVILGGKTLQGPDGKPLRINSDPMEVSNDGKWLYFGPLSGPWSRIATRWLNDAAVTPKQLATKVEAWADLPPTGGTALDANGDLYFSDLATDSLKRRSAAGKITTIITDKRLHWVDAPFIDADRTIWLPVPQLDRVGLFNGGASSVDWPVQLFRLPLPPAK